MPTIKNDSVMHRLGRVISQGNLDSVKSICEESSKRFNINDSFKNITSSDKKKGIKRSGHTPLTLALQRNKNTIAQYLIEHCDADVTAKGANRTPLETAIWAMNKEGVSILVKENGIKSELCSLNKPSGVLYQLQEMHRNETNITKRENILSILNILKTHGTNTECAAPTTVPTVPTVTTVPTAQIHDLTSMSSTEARKIIERNSHEFLEFTANYPNVSSTALPNQGIRNDIVNRTTGGDSPLIPAGNFNSTALNNDNMTSHTVMHENITDIVKSECYSSTNLLITGMACMVLGAGIVNGAEFLIEKYKNNKNYNKALEMTTVSSSNSSSPITQGDTVS